MNDSCLCQLCAAALLAAAEDPKASARSAPELQPSLVGRGGVLGSLSVIHGGCEYFKLLGAVQRCRCPSAVWLPVQVGHLPKLQL